jgi:hypothetical protein
MEITLKIDCRNITAKFVKSEDAGFSAGRLLLDLPNGEVISVYKNRRRWIEAKIANGICRSSVMHDSRLAACSSAAEEYAAAVLQLA